MHMKKLLLVILLLSPFFSQAFADPVVIHSQDVVGNWTWNSKFGSDPWYATSQTMNADGTCSSDTLGFICKWRISGSQLIVEFYQEQFAGDPNGNLMTAYVSKEFGPTFFEGTVLGDESSLWRMEKK